MSDEQSEKLSDEHNSQHEMGLMLQRRALHQMERASEKPPRDPRRIALVSLMVVVTMCLFLLFIDKGVKVTHRIIDIWAPVIFETKKPALSPVESPPPQQGSSASSSEAAYMISVEPAAPAQSSQSKNQNTKN
jgi:ABC-type phosphate/phosphonate transport system permease subunit